MSARREPPMIECELCCNVRECFLNRHRMLCSDCMWGEMQDNLKHEGFRVVEDGRETVYFADRVVPRAWNYR